MLALLAPALTVAQLRDALPAEQALDIEAFQGMDQAIDERLPDVQAAVVLLKGRVVYAYHRDGQPDPCTTCSRGQERTVGAGRNRAGAGPPREPGPAGAARDARMGAAERRPARRSDHAAPPADHDGGLRHRRPDGHGGARPPQDAWTRPLGSAPASAFAYDKRPGPDAGGGARKATGVPLADYARRELVAPLAMQEPSYRRGLHLRTEDMARARPAVLQKGTWNGKALLP